MTKAGQRKTYLARDVIRAAYLAGGGASAAEIGEEIGSAPERAYALCRRNKIKLLPKGPHQVAITLVATKAAFAEISKIAHKRRVDPAWLAARVFEACTGEPVLLRNLIDEIEEK